MNRMVCKKGLDYSYLLIELVIYIYQNRVDSNKYPKPMFLEVLNKMFYFLHNFSIISLKRRFRASLVIITNIVLVSNVGINPCHAE